MLGRYPPPVPAQHHILKAVEDGEWKAEMNMNDSRIRIFRDVFRFRQDCYGIAYENGGVGCRRDPLTDQVISDHLEGRTRIGGYLIVEGSKTNVGVVDMDYRCWSHVEGYLEAAEGIGIPAYIEPSKSKGYHLWHFFSEAVSAAQVRQLIMRIISIANLPDNLEVFPKQDSVSGDGVGNCINLPLFGTDIPDGKTVFLDPDNTYRPYEDQWEFLSNIQRLTPEALTHLVSSRIIQEPAHGTEDSIDAGNGSSSNERGSNDGSGDSRDDSGRDEGGSDDEQEYSDMLPCVPRMMEGVSEGCRDTVAFTLAKHFRVEKKLPQEATEAILQTWRLRNAPPLEASVIQSKVASAYHGKGGKGYTSLGCSDDLIRPFCDRDNCPVFKQHSRDITSSYMRGNTFIPRALADELMADYSFIYTGEKLYAYVDGVYSARGEGLVRQQCRERLGDEARVNRVNEVIAHIQDMNIIDIDELNPERYRHLINLKNGMYDYLEDRILPHSEEYLSTIRIPVVHEPQAECPTVDYYLATTLPPDCIYPAEELFGYALIPDTRYAKAFMLTGNGANGKSTFLRLLEAFIGSDNVSKVPLQELDGNRFKRADLLGKLINLFADLDSRALLGSSYFKTIVTGDTIDAERKHCDPFSFRPFARLVFSANETPGARDTSFAYYRRWCIIPFPHQFVGRDADESLPSRMTQPCELSGLLNRALRGLRRLIENKGFTESETARGALEEYRRQNDTVMAFISDCCELVTNAEVERTELYGAYVEYCSAEGLTPVSRNVCYSSIRAQGTGERSSCGRRYFTGIGIRELAVGGVSQ